MQFVATMEKLVLRYYNFFLEGVRNTLIIAFFAVLLGTLLGTLMAMARMSRIKPLKWLATAYIEFFRGTPLMVQLMFIFYGLPMIGVTFPSVSFIPDFDRFAAGIVAMSLNSWRRSSVPAFRPWIRARWKRPAVWASIMARP